MKRLSGAKGLKRYVLNKWNFKIRRTSKWKARRYLIEFPCPVCHGYSVYEDFQERMHEWPFGKVWSISWWSKCGHMLGFVTYPAEFEEIPVRKNGKTVATIVPFHRPLGAGGPLWERYEWGATSDESLPARFGTVWQALKASAIECGLLAVVQAKGGRDD